MRYGIVFSAARDQVPPAVVFRAALRRAARGRMRDTRLDIGVSDGLP
jgi:hypothetical protein